jgi:hypothetical protein
MANKSLGLTLPLMVCIERSVSNANPLTLIVSLSFPQLMVRRQLICSSMKVHVHVQVDVDSVLMYVYPIVFGLLVARLLDKTVLTHIRFNKIYIYICLAALVLNVFPITAWAEPPSCDCGGWPGGTVQQVSGPWGACEWTCEGTSTVCDSHQPTSQYSE